jgi:arylsulfatase A-like enzyme
MRIPLFLAIIYLATAASAAKLPAASQMAQVIRSGDWKLIHFMEKDEWELYNVHNDLNEDHNQIANNPELVRRL